MNENPRQSLRGHPGRIFLVLSGVLMLGVFLLLPLATIFHQALRQGWTVYAGHLTESSTLAAIRLTLLAAGLAVFFNTLFGISAAWLCSKFRFRGRNLLISIIELPLSISPIIFGVAYLFLFGRQGLFGPWLLGRGIRMVFTPAAVLIVTAMVTTPYVFRELLPLMRAQGSDEEQAALCLGAGGWQTFRRITLLNIKWALLYGMVLTFGRSLGEFGTVAVVSGTIRGQTNTMSLQIEMLFQDRVQTGAFAVASVLTLFSLFTLLLKCLLERLDSPPPSQETPNP